MAPPDAPPPETLLAETAWVARLARRLVLDPNAADDVAQSAWLEVLERPPAHARSPRGFLATVVRNAARKLGRAEGRRSQHEQAAARADAAPAPADVVLRAERQRELVGRVLALDEPYKTVVLLRFFEDQTTLEIARRLARPHATVKTQLQRALERLRARLDAEYGDRRAWGLALARLARATPVRHAAAHGTTGALAGWLALLVGLPALGLAVVAGVRAWGAASTEPGPFATLNRDAQGASVVGVADAERERAAPAESAPRPARVLHDPLGAVPAATRPVEPVASARVVDLAGRPLAGVAVRFVPADAPRVLDGQLFYRGTETEVRGIDGFFAIVSDLPERWRRPAWDFGRTGIADFATARAETAADGRFELAVDEPGAFEVDGFAVVGTPTAHAPGGPLERLVLVGAGAPIRGRVLSEDGEPLERVSLFLHTQFDAIPDFPFYVETESTTSYLDAVVDAAGRFTLDARPLVPWITLTAGRTGYEEASRGLHEGPNLELRLRRAAPRDERLLRGRVLHADGAPASGAALYLGPAAGRADGEGRFAIEVSASLGADDDLVAHARGFEPGRIVQLGEELVGPGAPSDVVVRLGPSTRELSGTVVDPEDNPRAGVSVALEDPTLLRPRSDTIAEQWRTTTDATGRFTLAELGDRAYALRVVDAALGSLLVTDPLRPAAGIVVRLPAPEPVSVRGRAVDRLGAPAADVVVTARFVASRIVSAGRVSTTHLTLEHTITDTTGRFTLENVPRAAELSFSAPFLEPHSVPVVELEARPVENEVVLDVLHSFRLEMPELPDFDAYEFHDAFDQRLPVLARYPDVTVGDPRVRTDAYPTVPVCQVGVEAAWLVLFDGERRVRSVPVRGRVDRVTVLVP